MIIPAKFEGGVFKPLSKVAMKEGTAVDVFVPAEEQSVPRPRSVGDSPFAGMWADRADMADSDEYIDRLRRDLHG